MRRTFFISRGIFLIIALALVGAWVLFSNNTPKGTSGNEAAPIAPASSTEAVVTAPLPESVVRSPLTVSGKAKGNWFFEANIPVVLKDEKGNVIAQAGGHAEGDWMTTDFVPFTATLTFTNPGTPYGTLEVKKDNPSGMSEHDASLSFPVKFDLAAYQVQVYWGSTLLNKDQNDCAKVFAHQKTILATTTIAHATLDELLKGPDAGEKRIGYFTSTPEGVTVQRVWIENGVAHVDFNDALNAGGSCRVTAIRSQIEHTLEQFPTVTSVVISVNGNSEEALQP